MILDGQLLFDNPSATLAATTTSTNIIDLGVGRDLGVGEPDLEFAVWASTAFATANGGTLQCAIQGAPDNGTGAPGTWTTLSQSEPFPVGNLGLGRVWAGTLPPYLEGLAKPRFLQMLYTVVNTFTAGQVKAMIVLDRQANGATMSYPKAFTNSF